MVDLLHPYEKLKLSVKVMFAFYSFNLLALSVFSFCFSFASGFIVTVIQGVIYPFRYLSPS